MSREHIRSQQREQLTGIRAGGTVQEMGLLRHSIDPCDVAPDVCLPAPCWHPGAFRNLGRGVF